MLSLQELIVIAPACTERIAQLFEEGKLVYKEKPYDRKICHDRCGAGCAVDDKKVNKGHLQRLQMSGDSGEYGQQSAKM